MTFQKFTGLKIPKGWSTYLSVTYAIGYCSENRPKKDKDMGNMDLNFEFLTENSQICPQCTRIL